MTYNNPNTNLNPNAKKAKRKCSGQHKCQRHPLIISILLAIWTIIRTVFVTYAVIFTIAGTIAIIVAYRYATDFYHEHLLKPFNHVMALKTENLPESAYMTQVRERLRNMGEPDTLVWRFVPLDSMSRVFRWAVLAAEDDGFYTHPGVSLDAIVEAIDRNRTANSLQRGGSTITQQLAKNLFLTPERTFERKIKELGYALLLEKYLGKDRILELYLNYAQWGKNIFGVEAAANVYFRKSAADLTLLESARMSACLSMPTKITPHHTKSGYMANRLTVIANNMYTRRRIDETGYMTLTGVYPHGKEPPPAEIEEDNEL